MSQKISGEVAFSASLDQVVVVIQYLLKKYYILEDLIGHLVKFEKDEGKVVPHHTN